MTERKLATIRRVADIQPIPDADNIHAVTVDGWKVVAQKAMGYKIGDLVVYFELDSWIPHNLVDLTPEGQFPKVFNGVEGQRLKTRKLRGVYSQGLLMPVGETAKYLTEFRGYVQSCTTPPFLVSSEGEAHAFIEEGADWTEALGIQKWEASLPAQLAGQAQGMFPTQFASKTDQERVQNMFREVYERRNEVFEWTLKLDGSSMSVFKVDGELRVASRNLELKIAPENYGNAYVAQALKVAEKIADVDNVVIQGELMGPGIQGNRENLKEVEFFVFDIVNPKTREKWNADARMTFVAKHGLRHVPVIGTYRELPFENVQEMLDFADSVKSINHATAEGVVFKSVDDPEFSFKVISNRFLIKNDG